MGDIQHETDVRECLIAPSDAQHLPSTTRFDDNQKASTEMKLPMYVDPPKAPPRPANFSKEIFKLYKYKYLKITFMAVVVIIVVVPCVVWSSVVVYQAVWTHADESDQPYIKPQQPKSENITNRPKQSANCVVPAHPEHGEYILSNAPSAKPGERFESLKLTVKCLPDYIAQNTYTSSGYLVSGIDPVYCFNGTWSLSLPKCVRFCKLDNNTSILYHCLVTGSSFEGRRTCGASEPSGTVVSPECNRPNYPFITLSSMTCINGSWDHVPDCSQECGRVTSNGVALMTDGRPAQRGEVPWHVGIYRKPAKRCPWPCSWLYPWLCPWLCPYEQICGGSLVSNSVVISAAHCFWDNVIIKKLPASRFAVAAGKIYRDWNDQMDNHAQKSDVKEINIPPLYKGGTANFHDDIAMVILETPFEYTPFVGHVCLSFDDNFERKQLQDGRLGTVAGWGVTAENGNASRILKVVELAYVNTTQCIDESPLSFRGHITSNKICAGYKNGTALCLGDSGGGLVFPDADRFYLRGIVSTAPSSENRCNIDELTTFTRILNYGRFIKRYL